MAVLDARAGASLLPGNETVALAYGRRDATARRLLAVADLSAVALALGATALVSSRVTRGDLGWGVLSLPMWILIFKAYGLYDRDIKRVSHTAVDDLPWLFHALVVGSVLMWLYFRLVPVPRMLFGDILVFAMLALVLALLLRMVARRITAWSFGPERVLFVGEGAAAAALARKMRSHPEYGLEPVGQITRSGSALNEAELRVLGELSSFDLTEVAALHRVDRVLVAHSDVGEPVMLDLLRRCKQLSLKVSVLPQLFDAMGPSLEVDDVEGITVLGISPPVLARSSRAMKRGLDIVGGSVALMLATPVVVLIAAAIKLDSRGPVLFRQERIGRLGERFWLLKFRTMDLDAEARRSDLLVLSTDPGWLKLDRDPRVTRVGRFLRVMSLDELPQLLNVLKGEMSLVGPRPLIEAEDRRIDGWGRSRLDLTPGITGLWQVLGRTNIPFEEMVKLDYVYVTNWSLWADVRLMLKTLPAVLTRRGAN
jgi:exopolysaccharide biosynthesis polyprenyl glycosylphosphotransferase